MSISKTSLLLPALLLLLLQSNAFLQTRLEGEVYSAEDSSAVVGATVLIRLKGSHKEGTPGTTTKPDGSFTFSNLPRVDCEIIVSMVGFEEFHGKLSPSAMVHKIQVFLNPLPVQAGQVVVTASKREQRLGEVPVSVSILSGAAVQRRNSLSLDDALRYVPGVNFIQDQVNIRGSSGYARGIGSRVLLLIDGIPLLSGDTGGANWDSIPMEDVDRVEVLKGAGSALYGSNALGGVINVITKNDVDASSTEVKLYGGLYDQPLYGEWRWSSKPRYFQGGTVSHTFSSGQIGLGDFGLITSLTYKKDDGYIDNDGFDNLNLFLKSAGTVGENQTLKVFGNIFTQHTGSFLWWDDLNHALQPPPSFLGEWVNSTRANVAGVYTNVVNSDFLYVLRGSYYFNYWYDNFGNPQGQNPVSPGDTSTSHEGYFEFQGTWSTNSLTVVTFGAEAEPDFLNSNLFSTRTSGSGAAYFQLERRLSGFLPLGNRMRTTIGARYDYEKIEGKPAFNQFNPKFGLVYNLGDGETPDSKVEDVASLRASIGSGFRAPSLSEIYSNTETGGLLIVPNPDLLPETSLSEEIGGRVPIARLAFVDAAIFQNDYWNMIEPEFNKKGNAQFVNVTRARVQGYEIDLSSDAGTDFLELDASYTYIYPRNLSDGTILKYRSREILYASVSASRSIFRASMDFRYLSKFENYDQYLIQIVNDADKRVPAYITDVRAGLDLTAAGIPIELDLIVNNLFEYYYVEMIGNIAPVRNYSVVVSMKF